MANLEEVKFFYDPHPGFKGALIPLPATVKKIVDKLSGQVMPLGEAVAKIKAVTDGEVQIKDGWIFLKLTEDNGRTVHGFKVISFGSVPPYFVSACCQGEKCSLCQSPATHKIGEEILPDDPLPDRHNLTAYVCCKCFCSIFGLLAPCVPK